LVTEAWCFPEADRSVLKSVFSTNVFVSSVFKRTSDALEKERSLPETGSDIEDSLMSDPRAATFLEMFC